MDPGGRAMMRIDPAITLTMTGTTTEVGQH
jgi:hypothetical protein